MDEEYHNRAAKDSQGMPESFAMSLASLVVILLCSFIYLCSRATFDPIKASKAYASISGKLIQSGAEAVKKAAPAAQILDIAKEAGFIGLEKNNQYYITLPDETAFESGSDQIQAATVPKLEKIAQLVMKLHLRVDIEGHTDNKPIRTARFPSNWELSAARAVSVLRVFIAQGASDNRLAAAGRGEYTPVASNDSDEGRAKNRRVELVISAEQSETERE